MNTLRFHTLRFLHILCLGLLSAGCLGFDQVVVASESSDSGFTAVVYQRAQSALFRLSNEAEGGGRIQTTGVFVSEEGHALCSPRAFTREELPKILTADSKQVEVEAILAMYPEQAVALVKLKERPTEWLALAKEPVSIGSEVAFLHPGQTPPVHVGPMLARRLGRAPPRPQVSLVRLLSIGARAPSRDPYGNLTLHNGDPLIDGQGRICGVFHGIKQQGAQLLIEAAPLDAIFDNINAVIDDEDPDKIPFPLPPEFNPYDPASEEPAYHLAVAAMGEGRIDDALWHVKVLFEKHPASAMVRMLELDILRAGRRQREFHSLLEELSRPDSRVKFDRISLLFHKASIAKNEEDLDSAIAFYKELVELTPQEFAVPRSALGDCYLEKGDATREAAMWEEAEKWYREALIGTPESIGLLINYQRTLDSLGRWDEATAMTRRIAELSRIYQGR